jgi:ABC-type multidrug transport system fused ATPase/permease subunit
MFSKNPFIFLMSKIWKYSKGDHSRVVAYISMSIIANLARMADPLLLGFVMNTIQKEGIHDSNIYKIVLLFASFLGIEIITWIFHGPSRVIENVNAFFVKRNYKISLLQGVMNLPLDWHTEHHSGDTIDKIEKGTKSLFDFSTWTFQIISAIITFISSLTVLLYFSVPIGIVSLALSAVIFKIIFFFDARLISGYKFVNHGENSVSEKVYDGLSNITTVVILKIQNSIIETISKSIDTISSRYKKNHVVNEFKWFLVGIFGRIIVFSSIIIYVVMNYHSTSLLIGSIYIVYNFSDALRKTFQSVAYLYSQMVMHQTSIHNSEELSEYFRDHTPQVFQVPQKWNKLQIKNLSFSYHGDLSENLHIDNISLDVYRGQKIAIIGESGGGKSTFLKLMRDLYHPKNIQLILDDDVIENGFVGISNSISLIPQEPEIFATTIRENITMGIDYPDEYLSRFIKMASFDEVIRLLPRGLDSSLVEKGVNLSGGQKQRLALVRGLLASENKDFVLLDEPTSSVDMVNELNIYKNIFDEFKGKTIISSVHKLYLLPLFDVIYFLKEGKIIASGNFQDLKKESKEFQHLIQHQEMVTLSYS